MTRSRDWRFKKFYCHGCKRTHGQYVNRTETLEGLLLCDRQYNKHLDEQYKAAQKANGNQKIATEVPA